jgi:hypothetical protein
VLGGLTFSGLHFLARSCDPWKPTVRGLDPSPPHPLMKRVLGDALSPSAPLARRAGSRPGRRGTARALLLGPWRRLGMAVNDEREERDVVTQLPPRGLDDEVLKAPYDLGAPHAGRCTEDSVEGFDADRLRRTPVPLLDETVAVEKQPLAGRKEALRRARPGLATADAQWARDTPLEGLDAAAGAQHDRAGMPCGDPA